MRVATLGDPQELQVLLLEQRDRVANALGKNRLEVGAVRRVRVPAREIRLGHVRDGRAGVPEDGRPLLDRLVEVLRIEGRITAITTSVSAAKREAQNTHAVPCQTCIFGRAPV